MVVKRKVLKESLDGGSIDLSTELKKVRDAISKLPDDEEIMNQETAATESKKAVKKAVAPASKKVAPAAKKVPAKKVVAAPAAKKVPNGDATQVTLADLCKTLKMEPGAARRKLRAAEVENPGRWIWAKDSSALKKVSELLSAE